MSAGFKYGDNLVWGTNGAIEFCLDVLLSVTKENPRYDEELVRFIREQRERFYMGYVVYLDEPLKNPLRRQQFAELLTSAIDRMSRDTVSLTDVGRKWVADDLSNLLHLIQHS